MNPQIYGQHQHGDDVTRKIETDVIVSFNKTLRSQPHNELYSSCSPTDLFNSVTVVRLTG